MIVIILAYAVGGLMHPAFYCSVSCNKYKKQKKKNKGLSNNDVSASVMEANKCAMMHPSFAIQQVAINRKKQKKTDKGLITE